MLQEEGPKNEGNPANQMAKKREDDTSKAASSHKTIVSAALYKHSHSSTGKFCFFKTIVINLGMIYGSAIIHQDSVTKGRLCNLTPTGF